MSKGGSPSIPSEYTFTLQGDAQAIQTDVAVTQLPTFEIKVTQFPETTVNTDVTLKSLPTIFGSVAVTQLPTVFSSVAVTELPVVKFALTEIPEQRVHLPSHYQLCFSLFGVELWSLSLCGETQAINEKYVPRRTEENCS
jgi:hypothetical protein